MSKVSAATTEKPLKVVSVQKQLFFVVFKNNTLMKCYETFFFFWNNIFWWIMQIKTRNVVYEIKCGHVYLKSILSLFL